MKTCIKCDSIKPLDEFYRHPKMADGHMGKCKVCTKADVSERESRLRATSPEWIKAERVRSREKQRRRRADGRDIQNPASKQQWSSRNPHKRRAHVMVARAVRSGRLIRQPCAVCGDTEAEAHHEDYARPLDVIWFCDTHHKQNHIKQREATIAGEVLTGFF